MFTIDQIAAAHAKVKSGADFPGYIQDIKALGVDRYTTFVHDGHTEYMNSSGQQLTTTAKYEPLPITPTANSDQFVKDLRAHQSGQSDYYTFCRQAATAGVACWMTDIIAMTCTYQDAGGSELLTEQIPDA